MRIYAPTHIQKGNLPYKLGIRFPDNTPKNGVLKFNITSGNGELAIKNSYLFEQRDSNYDAIVSAFGEKAGIVNLQASYTYKTSPEETAVSQPTQIFVVELFAIQTSQAVAGRSVSFEVHYKPPDAPFDTVVAKIKLTDGSEISSVTLNRNSFTLSKDTKELLANLNMPIPANTEGMQGYLELTAYYNNNVIAIYNSELFIISAQLPVPLGISFMFESIYAKEGQAVILKAVGSSPDVSKTFGHYEIFDESGALIITEPLTLTEVKPNAFESTFMFTPPSGSAGKFFTAKATVFYNSSSTFATLTINVLRGDVSIKITTRDITVKEGEKKRFEFVISPALILGDIISIAYKVDIKSPPFVFTGSVDLSNLTSNGTNIYGWFELLIPQGSVQTTTEVDLVLSLYGLMFQELDAVRIQIIPVDAVQWFVKILSTEPIIKLRENLSANIPFVFYPSSMADRISAITVHIFDGLTKDEVYIANIDPKSGTVMNDHLYYIFDNIIP